MADFIAKHDTSSLSAPDWFQEVVILQSLRGFAIINKLLKRCRAWQNRGRYPPLKSLCLLGANDVPRDEGLEFLTH